MFIETLTQYAPWLAELLQFVLLIVLYCRRKKVKDGTATVEDLTALRDYHAKMVAKLDKELKELQK